MTDFAARRTMMVDTQVRPSDVTKFPIIDAMLSVPKQDYVPDDMIEAAYVGENITLPEGRIVLEPRTFAKMLDALDIQPGDMVLDLGCGFGYSSAVLGHMAEAVVGVESDEAMAEEAQSKLSAGGVDNVAVMAGELAKGAAKHGPYDVILLHGGVEKLPQSIIDQLKDGGRIACLFMEGALGACRIGYKAEDSVSWRFAFNASAPLVAGFEKERSFAL